MREDRGVNATDTDTRAPQADGGGPGLPARAFDRLLRDSDLFREQLQLTVHRMGLSGTGKRLLVIGCGGGAAVQGVPEEAPGWRVVAIDESHELTRHANEENWPSNYWFLTATLNTLEDTLLRHNLQGRFDAVLVVFQMRQQRNLDDTLAFLRELLVPGGPLAVHEYSVRGNRDARNRWRLTVLGYLARIRSHGRVPGMTEFLWRSVTRFDSVGEFRERLQRARFTDVRVQTFGGRQEHVLHTFLARAPSDEPGAGGADDLGLPYTDAPVPGQRVRGRVVLPRSRETPELTRPTDEWDEPRQDWASSADPEADTPPDGSPAVPPRPSPLPRQPHLEVVEEPRVDRREPEPPAPRRVAATLPADVPADDEPYDLDDDLDDDLDEHEPPAPAADRGAGRVGDPGPPADPRGAERPGGVEVQDTWRPAPLDPEPSVDERGIGRPPERVEPQETRQPAPPDPEPSRSEPSHPEPSYPEPSHPEPSHPEPSHPEPSHPEPSHPEPSPPEQSQPERSQEPSPAELPQEPARAEQRVEPGEEELGDRSRSVPAEPRVRPKRGLVDRLRGAREPRPTASDGSWLPRAEREQDEER